jgi:hypothetical protein
MGKRRTSSSRRINRSTNLRSNRRSTRVKRGKGSRIKRNSRKKGSLRPKRTKRIRRRNKIQVGGSRLSPSGKGLQGARKARRFEPRDSQEYRLRRKANALMEKQRQAERLRLAEEEEEKGRGDYSAAEKATKEQEITEMITEFYKLKNLHKRWDRMASWTSGGTKAMDDIIDTLAENCLPARHKVLISHMCQFMLNEFIEKELQDVLTTNIADNWDKLKDLQSEHPDLNVDTSPDACEKAMQSVIEIFNKRGKDLSGAAFTCFARRV